MGPAREASPTRHADVNQERHGRHRDRSVRGDVLVEDEKIAVIGTSLDIHADKVIDAGGKYVLPGGIDVHTHLDMPFGGATSADDFETGTIAAAFGGTTSVVDFAIQYKGRRCTTPGKRG